MKKFLLFVTVVSTLTVKAQDCSDLIISEYIEGTGNNKAIELYNTTNAVIDMSSYRVVRYDNGSLPPASASQVLLLSGAPNTNLAAFTTFVICLNANENNQITDTAIVNRADWAAITSCDPNVASSRALCHNGDDAIALEKNVGGNWELVDLVGVIGERPVNYQGSTSNPTGAWTSLSPFHQPPSGFSGFYQDFYWTADQTLIRKASVKKGTDVSPTPRLAGDPAPSGFDPTLEWDTLGLNYFQNLGIHDCECANVSVEEQAQAGGVRLFPNPASDKVNIAAIADFNTVTVYSITGQAVFNQKNMTDKNNFTFDVSGFRKGVYLVEILLNNGQKVSRRLIIK